MVLLTERSSKANVLLCECGYMCIIYTVIHGVALHMSMIYTTYMYVCMHMYEQKDNKNQIPASS